MRNFTDKTENFEKMPVYIAIKEFFDSFFVERNYGPVSRFSTK